MCTPLVLTKIFICTGKFVKEFDDAKRELKDLKAELEQRFVGKGKSENFLK